MQTLLYIFAGIGVIAVAGAITAIVMFIRQVNKNGWGQ